MSQYLLKWFYLGLNLKHWLGLFAIAAIIAGLGFAYLLRTAYLAIAFPDEIYWLTLQFIPRWIRGLLFIVVAVVLALISNKFHRLFRQLSPSLMMVVPLENYVMIWE